MAHDTPTPFSDAGKQEAARAANPANVLPVSFYESVLSDVSKHRIEDPIRALLHLHNSPGVISLLAGQPNTDTFPITSLQFNVRAPASTEETTISLNDVDLARSLQYSPGQGIPEMLEWLTGCQEYMLGRKRGPEWSLAFGTGSSDFIYKAVNALINPGDAALIETPVYAGVLPVFHALYSDVHEVNTDADGICSHELRKTLENWPTNKPKPKLLYTVPFGANPSGYTSTVERRREILQLSREHNFIILEDDPYHYLYYGNAPRPPTYFALELDEPEIGRVLRFDSFSKVLAAGMRLGFVSGPTPLVHAINMHTMNSNLQPPTFTQIIALRLLEHWGYAGLRAHTDRVAQFYRAKRDVFERAMRKHLDGLAEWDTPEAGMFFWFKIKIGAEGHADEDEYDSATLIREKALANGVLALPGTVFLPSGRKSLYVRAAFSLVPDSDVDEALARLRSVILDARAERQ